MNSSDKHILDMYLRSWGQFMRTDRACKAYSALDWGDFTGENPVAIEDAQLERICAAMRYLRPNKPQTYSVAYTVYVDQVSEKQAGKHLDISRQRVSDYKLDCMIFLHGAMWGIQYVEDNPGRIERWGEVPEGPLAPPETMKQA